MYSTILSTRRRRRWMILKREMLLFHLLWLVCFHMAWIFAFGPVLQKNPCLSKNKSDEKIQHLSCKRGKWVGTLVKLFKAEFLNEILSPFSNAKCHWTNFQVGRKIVFVCNFSILLHFCPCTVARSFKWVHWGVFRALFLSHRGSSN